MFAAKAHIQSRESTRSMHPPPPTLDAWFVAGAEQMLPPQPALHTPLCPDQTPQSPRPQWWSDGMEMDGMGCSPSLPVKGHSAAAGAHPPWWESEPFADTWQYLAPGFEWVH